MQDNKQPHAINHVELLTALRRAQETAQEARLEVEEAKAQIKQSQEEISQIADKALDKYPLS
jgi:F0F1-type ATP synthase membrane subunit b/b'